MVKRKRKGASAAFLRMLRRKHRLGEFKKKEVKVLVRHPKLKMARKRFSKRQNSDSGFNNQVIGAVAYGAIGENLLDQLTTKLNLGVSTDIIKGVVGYFVAKKTAGIIRGMGQAAVAVSAYKIGKTGLSFIKPK